MELHRPRSSSIPRKYHRIAQPERFSVTDAVHLKLKLQSLDAALSGLSWADDCNLNIRKIADACRPRPFHETVYVDGSEEFYLLVKSIPRPDLIPDVYAEAYKAVLLGRPYVNEYTVSDFSKGVDPTFSEIRVILDSIDQLCETDLKGAFDRLELQVKPFPFLRLPAELRLQVFTYVLPREPHIALLSQPLRDHRPLRSHLQIMRTCMQLHDEVRKYLYQNRTLFVVVARDSGSITLSDEFAARPYEIIASMAPQTRELFTSIEIQIGYLSYQMVTAKRFTGIPNVPDPIHQMFVLLPNLKTLLISFTSSPYAPNRVRRIFREYEETVDWLIRSVPPSIDVRWDLIYATPPRGRIEDQPIWRILDKRGTVKMGGSIVTFLEQQRTASLQKNLKALGFLNRTTKRL